MADSNQLTKETVSLELPPDVITKPAAANPQPRETVRIQLPPRPPSPPPPTVSTASPSETTPAPAPVMTVSDPVSPAPNNETARLGIAPELKKETARIPLTPEPPSKPLPTVQMKKTQPLGAMPEAAARGASISVASGEKGTTIRMPLCWTLLGVSAIILIIQIWIYFS